MAFDTVAHCLIALGGDSDNTVPRADFTVAELAVLQEIHGHDAVFDIVPGPSVDKAQRAEREHLRELFGRVGVIPSEKNSGLLNSMFPGAAARVFEAWGELDIRPEQFRDRNSAPKVAADELAAEAAVRPLPSTPVVEDLDELEPDHETADALS